MTFQRRSPTKLDSRARANLLFGLIASLTLFAASGLVSHINTRSLNTTVLEMAGTHETLLALHDVLSLVKDAETGQRGFVLTSDEKYLAPYNEAVIRLDSRLEEIARRMQNVPGQQSHLTALRQSLEAKLRELSDTITLQRTQGFEAARNVVVTDRGKIAMDAIRSEVQSMVQAERVRRDKRIAAVETAYNIAVISGILTSVSGMVLCGVIAYLARKTMLTRQKQDWLQEGQIGLSMVMVGDQRLDRLGEQVLQYLAEYLDAQAGVFFAKEGDYFRRVASYGVPTTAKIVEHFDFSDGLLGQAAKEDKTFVVEEIPNGYLAFGSALGHGKPNHLLIASMTADDAVNAVLELGFVHPVQSETLEFLEGIAGSIGIAVRTANDRVTLQNLLEDTQRQAEELQAQGEELRVSNEELEEQSRALKESQTRLENQQAELEQTNAQLEEQAQILETQRDEAARARRQLQQQANELELSSKYKSDFLSNMSHELRTPLNSSLILAKLLADNPNGNLTGEQVKYAQTIQSAGNDLLTLINDILDLSKIEAGHMEMHPEPVKVQELVENMVRQFQPMAQQKNLLFQTKTNPGCVEVINTDRQRLEQILKNLLSNAMKFTEQGQIGLSVGSTPNGRIAFAVTDTGIGIPANQQQMIFEAFRQADGTTNRKYGGTGLGLSISRELARKLGGDIEVSSEVGHGSTFVVSIPVTFNPDARSEATSLTSRQSTGTLASSMSVSPPEPVSHHRVMSAELLPTKPGSFDDDRARLTGDRRVILAVEDDKHFAQILYDLAHEMNFQCLIAMSAEEGIAVATQYLPSAVVLDVKLPDHSGLSVLDRLKHDARTRHIPVHVISAGDFAQASMELGAVGYLLKPVRREALVDTLHRLEDRLAQRLRRVLIVEDDPVQLESLQKLLGTHDVATLGAASAAECLQHLKSETFDCMVLDLSLPDASGFSLLETLSREDAYSFPPVIVYTGRDLSIDEEQRLRRYSKSIIIKGAKSPERLLDEVTLFLHQVVAELPAEQQRMLEKARSRDSAIEGRRILIVEDDVRNVFALTSILEPRGAILEIARNGREALETLERLQGDKTKAIDLVLMDVMMPEMDGLTATIEIRKRQEWKKLPIIVLTAKAMSDDQEQCLAAGANDYMSKPLDLEKLLSLVRVWMPR